MCFSCNPSKDWTCCFSCPYPDCIYDDVTSREKQVSDSLDELAYRAAGEISPIRAKRTAYYQEHKERARAYYQENKERARRYYQEHKEELRYRYVLHREERKAAALARYYAKKAKRT